MNGSCWGMKKGMIQDQLTAIDANKKAEDHLVHEKVQTEQCVVLSNKNTPFPTMVGNPNKLMII